MHRLLGLGTGPTYGSLPDGIPEGSRAPSGAHSRATCSTTTTSHVSEPSRHRMGGASHSRRWPSPGAYVTLGYLGAHRCEQRRPARANVAALDHLEFTPDELAAIDQYAVEGGIDFWRGTGHILRIAAVCLRNCSCRSVEPSDLAPPVGLGLIECSVRPFEKRRNTHVGLFRHCDPDACAPTLRHPSGSRSSDSRPGH